MLNKIWAFLIIVSFLFMLSTGEAENINQSIFDATNSTVEIVISFLGTICLWNGMMKILRETSLIDILKKILKPVMKILFPKIKIVDDEYECITMNIIANVLGMGNAATPMGLEAMEKMQKKNKIRDTLTNDMIMFIVINTSSIQLIPTTVLAIRNSLGSSNSTCIILPIWITSISALIIGVILNKILQKNF